MIMPKRHLSSANSEDSASIGFDDSQSVCSNMSARKKKRLANASPLEICQEIYEKIRNYKNEDGKLLCENFIRVPNKRALAEYYDSVKQPIDMLKIQHKIKSEEYETVEELVADFHLLVENAKNFYKPESQEFEEACELWEIVHNEKQTIDNITASANAAALLLGSGSERRQRRSRKGADSTCDDDESDRQSVTASEASAVSESTFWENHFEALFSGIVNHITDDGRELAATFRYLPSREVYPQYYDVIKEPMDLHTVAQKVVNGSYTSLDEMEKDLLLMVKNAKAFNEPKSQIYFDAVAMSKLVKSRKNKIEHSRSAKSSDRIRGRDMLIDPHAMTVEFANTEPPLEITSADTTLEDIRMSTDEGEETEDDDIVYDKIDPRHLQFLLYNSLVNYKNPVGASLSTPFMKLPSKKLYADYYQEIKKPLSFANVRQSIKRNHYMNLDEIAHDFDLVFNNAQHYNKEDSMIFKNAMKLQKFMRAKKEELEKFVQPQDDYGDDLQPLIPQSLPVILPQFFQQESAESRPHTQTHMTTVNSSALATSTPYKLPPSGSQTIQKTPPMSANTSITTPTSGRGSRKPMTEQEIKEKRLNNLYRAVYEYQENGRFLREIFMVLPSKQDYPAYYDVIKDPIDLTMIRKKIDDDKYTCHQELVSDLRLMFRNARTFNEENSQVYTDAVTLENVVKKKLKNLGPSVSGSRSKKKVLVPMSSPVQPYLTASPLQRKLTEFYYTVKEYRDSSGRILSEPFMRLPSRQELPAYYEFIKRPIEMQTIGTKVAQNKYSSLEELVLDFQQMFDNACNFNEPESVIYKDALTLQRVCLEKKNQMSLDSGEDRIPDVGAAVQDIMRSILAQLITYTDEEGRCLSDSLSEVMSAPLTLDKVKRYLDLGKYRRVDRFQEDIFSVLRYARKNSKVDSQVFEDAAELQRIFIQVRDKECRRGELLLTPALSYTEKHLDEDLDEERDVRAGTPSSAACPSTDDEEKAESDVESLAGGSSSSSSVTSITIQGKVYYRHEFVYIEPMNDAVTDFHIACLEEILPPPEPPSSTPNVRVRWYYRPQETFHVATRKFLQQEVFKAVAVETLPADKIIGKCHVLFVKDYFKFKPKNYEEKDVYVCESRYAGRLFKKIRHWSTPLHPNVELTIRDIPLQPVRYPSVFKSESTDGSNSDTISVYDDKDILDKAKENVIQEDKSSTEGLISYDQFITSNGLCIKVGDAVYMPHLSDPSKKMIVRVDKLWRSTVQNMMYVSGPFFIRPAEVEHLPTRTFYKKEVILSSQDHCTHLLTSISGKCVVLVYSDYCAYRPTEYSEDDIYLCESKYFIQDKAIRKLKKGLKKFQLKPEVCDDEIYFFRKSIVPAKEPSPLLFQASQEPISFDLINNPPACLEDDSTMASFLDDSNTSTNTPRPVKKSKKLRKPPSGYVIYAGEVRKQLLHDRPDAPFGEISREVGLLWRNLPQDTRDKYEKRAQLIKKQFEESQAAAKAEQEALEAAQLEQQQQAANAAAKAQSMSAMSGHMQSPSPAASSSPQQIINGSIIQQGGMQTAGGMRGGAPGTMQFYQTQNGQLVQVVHSNNATTYQNVGGVQTMPGGEMIMNQQGATQPGQPQQVVYQFAAPNTQHATGNQQSAQIVVTQMPQQHPQQVLQQQQQSQRNGAVSPAVSMGFVTGGGPSSGIITNATGQGHPQGALTATGAGVAGQPMQVIQQVNPVPPPRTPSPVFVSVAPRTARTLHSDIYQRYIDRVRRNKDYLSDWPKQLSASQNSTPLAQPIADKANQIASNFIATENQSNGGQFGSTVEALWALRDHLMKDAFNIRSRVLGFEEL